MAAAVAGARLRDRLSAASFGWRQPVALLITVAAVATPVAAAALWLNRGVGPLLRSGGAEVLPAFVRDADASRGQPRTIVLRPPTALPLGVPTSSAPTDTVTYALLRDRSPRLGDGDLPPDPGQVALLDTAVADLAGGFGRRAATELAHAGVRYVLTPERDDAGLATRIATAGGLLPKTHDGGWVVWQVQTDAGRLAIATEGDDTWRLADGSGAVGKDSPPITVPYAPNPRLLVLAEAPSANWRAVAIGATGNARVPLAATTIEGMQAFALPTAGGQVVVQRAPDQRANWLVFQLVALLVVLGAAIPSGRRSDRRGPGRRGRARAAGRADDAADARDPIGAASCGASRGCSRWPSWCSSRPPSPGPRPASRRPAGPRRNCRPPSRSPTRRWSARRPAARRPAAPRASVTPRSGPIRPTSPRRPPRPRRSTLTACRRRCRSRPGTHG
jgi:hypothetical protein